MKSKLISWKGSAEISLKTLGKRNREEIMEIKMLRYIERVENLR